MLEHYRGSLSALPETLRRYGVVFLSVLVAVLLTGGLWSWVGPYTGLLLVAVSVSAWYGGLVPGVSATLLATLAFLSFLSTTPIPSDVMYSPTAQLSLFAFSAVFLSVLLGLRRRTADLAETEERLQLFVEGVKDAALFTLDAEGRVTSWNSGAERLQGYQAHEVMGQPIARFYTREDIEQGKPEQDVKSAATHGRFEDQGWRVRKDGRRFWAVVAMTPLTEQGNRLRGFAQVTRDITQRKQTEEERTQMLVRIQNTRTDAEKTAETARRFQLITEAGLAHLSLEDLLKELLERIGKILVVATRAILLLEPDGHSLWVRAAGGLEEEEIGRGLRIPLNPEFFGRILSERKAVMIEDARQTELYSPILREKGIRSLLGVPLLVDNRAIGLMQVGTLHPRRFTEEEMQLLQTAATHAALAIDRTRLDKALQGARAELDHRVAERTAKLQEANAELEGFAYTVSHDLRAPLRAMQGFAQALLEDYAARMDGVAQDYATRIVDGARRMDKMIEDLLSYSRVVTGTQLDLQPVSLKAVVQEVLTALDGELKTRRAQIKIVDPLMEVIGHHSTLVHIVQNLLTNAIKFVPPGVPPQIQIWSETRDWWVRLWVEDNGIGIEPDHQERIFRVFERLRVFEQLHTQEAPGTGIGLAIVRKAAESMGGQVGVESQLGHGSRFWVELQQNKERS